jgi:hypothetical protein
MGQETTNDLILIISQQSCELQHPKVARLMAGNICKTSYVWIGKSRAYEW